MTRNRSSEFIRGVVAPVGQELAKTALLLALLVVSVSVLLQILRGGGDGDGAWHERLWRTMADAGQDANGLAIAPRFFHAARQSLAIVLAAAALVGLTSFVLGSTFALRPASSVLRLPLTAISAVPAFMFPAVMFIVFGVQVESAWFWPAVCLAVGDFNLAALTGHCFDGLRRELQQPYVRTARALGLSVWSDLWPRAALVALEGLRTRVPHLLGGTVAIEQMYNIHGLGHMALSAVIAERPDYNVLVWIAGLGIVATRALSLIHRVARAVLTPDRNRPTAWSTDGGGVGLAKLWSGGRPAATAVELAANSESWPSPAATEPIERPGPWLRATERLRAYWHLQRANRVKVVLACATVSLGVLLGALVLWGGGYSMLDDTEPLLEPSWQHPLGTNDEREDVLSKIALGGRQMILPLAAALAVAIVIGGVFGTISGLTLRCAADAGMDMFAELCESVPKLVIVLAAITYMSYEHYELKVFLVMGLAFSPILYRAVRDEVGALRTSLFLEASLTLGVSRRRILWTHVLKNHALPVLAVEAASLVGYLLLFDAILGYCGVRQRGEVFTWGSLLGTGLGDLSEQLGAGVAANSMIVWGPFTAMLCAITCSAVIGDALKSLGRSVRFSQ